MEMISAVKMRRAVEQVLKIRPYAFTAWSVLTNLAGAFERYDHPLLKVRSVRRVLMIVVGSNRGLCGSFNVQIYKKLVNQVRDTRSLAINRFGGKRMEGKGDTVEVEMIAVGKKAESMGRRLNLRIVATFPNIDQTAKILDISPLAKIAIDDYGSEKYDKVVLVYMDYVSAIVQQPKIRQIMPISRIDLEKQIAEMDVLADEFGLQVPTFEYKVEPSPEAVLDAILPNLIRMQMYHAILESAASQEAARMVAMKNASEAAGEIGSDLTLMYNQVRQSKITQEIAEISAGRAVLET